jgi:tripartite-type tricarboxylate transporter receptor subunit TctC
MKMRIVSFVALTSASLVVTLASIQGALAQADSSNPYPTRAIRIVVGFGPGGGNDILARLIGQKLSESFGQPVIIDNKPGGGAIVATEHVKNAAPDGYTLLMGASGAMAVNAAVYAKLNYDTLRDFVPISMVASFPMILVVHPSLPAWSVAELAAYAKANPMKANYGASSAAFQLATELFKMKTGAPMEYIAYKSSGESVSAVLSDQVLLTIADPPPLVGPLKSGQLRALAVTSPERVPEFPDVPTMAEAGVAGMELALWSGLFAPARTPPAIVKKLQDEVVRIVQLPDIHERMKFLSANPEGNLSEEFRRIIERDIAQWTTVAKASNVKIEQ